MNAFYTPAYENILLDDAGRKNFALAGGACTMDIDGDGTVSATTDGAFLARTMLGLIGTAFTQNVIGVSAARTDPEVIRAYLVDRCKMPLS